MHQGHQPIVCNEVKQQITSFCVTSFRPWGMGGGCTEHILGGLMGEPLCLRTSHHIGQNGLEVTGLPMQENHSDCSRVAQHALVLGPSGHVESAIVLLQYTQSAEPALQSDPPQESAQFESSCLAPRVTAIKEKGFSEAVAAQIKAPKIVSTKSVFEAKWTIFTNIRHQSDWSKVTLYPSPGFLSKNQLAKGGPDIVVPVVIPALAPTLDKSLREDKVTMTCQSIVLLCG